jgi:putative addiction module component (TIGR02574 family)
MSTDELVAELLRLPRPERARVAEQVLSSLEETEDAVAAAWADELTKRSHDVSEGKVQALDWEGVRADILSELKQRRARRSSS